MRDFTALMLVMTSAGTMSTAWTDPEAAPPAPAFTIPFDEQDESNLQAELTRQILTFLQTVQAHWGQRPESLR